MYTIERYRQVLLDLYSLKRQMRDDWNLDAIQTLLQSLGNPQLSYRTVHITGSNGKGSLCWKLSACLQRAGLKTGRFTSPHLHTFRERVTIDGEMISKEDALRWLLHLSALAEKLQLELSFFEFTTAVAFCYFQEQKVDIAVIEVGLGGRLDCTNVIQPVLVAITSISLDHTELLGNHREEIAAEKSAIIKEGCEVVIGPHADLPVIRERAARCNAPLHVAFPRKESYEVENQEIANLAWQLLSRILKLDYARGSSGIKVTPPCRFEKIPLPLRYTFPYLLCDVAHNENGFEALTFRLREELIEREFCFLLSLTREKNPMTTFSSLRSFSSSTFILTELPSERSHTLSDLREGLTTIGCNNCYPIQRVDEAISFALAQAEKLHLPLIVCGSFFLVHPLFHELGITTEE